MEKKPITELTKEGLSEAVGDGIYNGFWSPLLTGLIIVSVAYIILLILLTYIFPLIFPPTNGDQAPVMERNCFPLENLDCYVVVGNETTGKNTGYFTICGYHEANAYFEIKKPRIQIWLDEEHPSWRIKRLECGS